MKFHDREIQIMRQSQSKMALEYVTSIGVSVTVEELQRITDIFVECCLRPIDSDLRERIKKLDVWLKEKQNGEGRN